jgi:hypothetical protein
MRAAPFTPTQEPVHTRTIQARRSAHLRWLGGALLASAGLKAALLASGAVPFNSDEAVVALMARHILQGARPVFFYGQAYMGSLDAFLVALGFSLFGEQVWVIRLVQGGLYLGTLATTAALGKVSLGSWRAGLLAAWLLAIPTVNVTLYTTVSLGGYGEMLLLGNLILLAALRIGNYLKRNRPPPRSSWLAFGFLSGLGLWTFGLTLVYSVPASLYLAVVSRRAGLVEDPARRRLPAPLRRERAQSECLSLWAGWAGWIVLGSLAGAAPWLGYAFTYGPAALIAEIGGSAVSAVDRSPYFLQVARHAFNLLVLGLPAVLGMRPPWEVRWLAVPLLPFTLAFWFGVGGFSIRRLIQSFQKKQQSLPAVRTGSSKKHFHPGRRSYILDLKDPLSKDFHMPNTARWLLSGLAITLGAGFILTPFGVDPSGRYFLPLAVVFALFAAEMILFLRESWGRLAYGLVGLVLAFNALGTLECVLRNPPGLTTQFDAQTRVDHRYDQDLIDFLIENEEWTGYSNYWAAYPLAFLSQETVIFIPDLPYHQDLRHTSRDNRYQPYARQVGLSGKTAFITTGQPVLEDRLREGFASLGVDWQEKQIGDYRVFYGLSQPVRPEALDLSPAPR